jgi:hypothetical protein
VLSIDIRRSVPVDGGDRGTKAPVLTAVGPG